MTRQGSGKVLLAVVLLFGCGTQETERPVRDETEAEVGAFLESYMDAISARDADLIRRSLVDGGRFVWLEDGEVRYRAPDDLLSSLAQFPPSSPIRTDLNDVMVVRIGETGAHAWAGFRTTVGEGAGAFTFGGAISFVLERHDDSWALVGGHTSAPRPR